MNGYITVFWLSRKIFLVDTLYIDIIYMTCTFLYQILPQEILRHLQSKITERNKSSISCPNGFFLSMKWRNSAMPTDILYVGDNLWAALTFLWSEFSILRGFLFTFCLKKAIWKFEMNNFHNACKYMHILPRLNGESVRNFTTNEL